MGKKFEDQRIVIHYLRFCYCLLCCLELAPSSFSSSIGSGELSANLFCRNTAPPTESSLLLPRACMGLNAVIGSLVLSSDGSTLCKLLCWILACNMSVCD